MCSATVDPQEGISGALLAVDVERSVGFKPDCLACQEVKFVRLVLRESHDLLRVNTGKRSETWVKSCGVAVKLMLFVQRRRAPRTIQIQLVFKTFRTLVGQIMV